MLEVDAMMALQTQVLAMQNMLIKYFNNLSLGQKQALANMVQQQKNSWCDVCRGKDHYMEHYGANPEVVNFVGNANKGGHQGFGNNYYPNWRNHPNISRGGNQQSQGPTQHKL